MEGPSVKRPKLNTSNNSKDWLTASKHLEELQNKLITGCLCNIGPLNLYHPPSSCKTVNPLNSSTSYTLQFISTLRLLCELASSQRGIGYICAKVAELANDSVSNRENWELLLEFLGSPSKYVSFAASKCLTSLLLWTRVSSVNQVFEDLLNSTVTSKNPFEVAHCLEVVRGILEHSDEDEHPLQLLGSGLHGSCNPKPKCTKLETDEDNELEPIVKNICVKCLESWWTRLLMRFKNLILQHDDSNEAPILTFLSIWQILVSVKSNLDVGDTKLFFYQVQSFVSLLNSTLSPTLWKKLVDVFNEILCYGSTLSLQSSLPEEPCNVAHVILRNVKSRQFLQGIPYTTTFYSFGGASFIKPVDFQWESDHISEGNTENTESFNSLSMCTVKDDTEAACSSSNLLSLNKEQHKVTTVEIGPSEIPVEDPLEELVSGDKPLLQKVILMILKCVSISVRETKDDVDSSDDEEDLKGEDDQEDHNSTASSSDLDDMLIIQRSVREVFDHLDSYIKSILSYDLDTPLCIWIVKLFSDQDDVLIEGMLCALDSFTSFIGRTDISTDFYNQLNPVLTFLTFIETISEDKDVIIDLLIGNETCFLLYLLRLLKYITRNWNKFVGTCEDKLTITMEMFRRLRLSLENSPHFPYNIDPIIRLLEICEKNKEETRDSISCPSVQETTSVASINIVTT